MLLSVIALLAFTVAAGSLTHMGLSTRRSNGEQAQLIAESTLAMVTRKILVDNSIGKLRKPTDMYNFSLNGGEGRLTFNPSQAALWKIDYSTNNLDNSNSTVGYNPAQPVPKAALQLIATGSVRGVTRRVETVLYVPPFPYAIASAGAFQADLALTLGSLNHAASVTDIKAVDNRDLLPASLAANEAGSDALKVGPGSDIVGDVKSAGGILVDSTSVVGGAIKAYSGTISIPKETITAYDPEANAKPGLQFVTPGDVARPTYRGYVKVKGNLAVTGGLKLDNGALYVDGNLTVSGGIQGSGAVFVTHNLSLSGNTSMTTDNTVAVMSGGDVNITGNGSSASSFQGLLYNEGNFNASSVSLIGTFIQNKPEGKVTLKNTHVTQVQDTADMQIPISNQASGADDLTKGNLSFNYGNMHDLGGMNLVQDLLGNLVVGVVAGNPTVKFDAYPLLTGGWELVDPNSRTIKKYATKDDVKQAILDEWNSSARNGTGKSRNGGIIGLAGVRSLLGLLLPMSSAIPVSSITSQSDRERFFALIDQQLANVPARASHSSQMLPIPPPIEEIDTNPSRFLSLDSTIKVLYWRAR